MKLMIIMQTARMRGAERVASVISNELVERGHDVYMTLTGFLRGSEFPLSDKIHVEYVPEAEGNRLSLFALRIRFIKKKIKEINPDCIVSLADARTIFMITVAHIGSSVPMIFSERHDPVHNPKTKAERILRMISYSACNRVVFQTEGARKFFPKKIYDKGIIISNPIMDGLPQVFTGERKPYIATFCKLDPQKNLPLLLRSFRRIAGKYPGLRLVIYGDGNLKQSLEDEARQLDIHSRTDFFPHSLDVHSLINDCSMFVSSSDYEGQSNSMLEAMAMGLPCVCTDCPCGGARAVIESGVNGILVPVGDEEKLAEAMCYMLDHPEEAQRMGNNASAIREERKPHIIAEKWEQLIKETISGT